ncbi:hypothetical protein [Leifsonia xyli]|uniref:hypothetical protein n=1 Tax=Leifsonia xyli TaxID=1575 RepID=UPI003D6795D6
MGGAALVGQGRPIPVEPHPAALDEVRQDAMDAVPATVPAVVSAALVRVVGEGMARAAVRVRGGAEGAVAVRAGEEGAGGRAVSASAATAAEGCGGAVACAGGAEGEAAIEAADVSPLEGLLEVVVVIGIVVVVVVVVVGLVALFVLGVASMFVFVLGVASVSVLIPGRMAFRLCASVRRSLVGLRLRAAAGLGVRLLVAGLLAAPARVCAAAEALAGISAARTVPPSPALGQAVRQLLGGGRTVREGVEDAPASAAQVQVGERVAHPLVQPTFDHAEPVTGRRLCGVVDVRHRWLSFHCMYCYK